MRFVLAVVAFCAAAAMLPGRASARVHLLPRPREVTESGCRVGTGALLGALDAAGGDEAGRTLLRERWTALGIRSRRSNLAASARIETAGPVGRAQAYTLDVRTSGAALRGGDGAGLMYAYATLAQLAEKSGSGWYVPCVHVADAPALQWRILSDDVSRGPLPTMHYFEERIRTIASFKMNGYSPYMEHVFVDPRHPLPAPLDGITPEQLHELDAYARRFHVALVPEQQTFAHMHETLKLERYAPLAELPHGYLLTPANPGGEAYVRDLLADELAAVPAPPFFHIGSDEPSDLGRGRSKSLVAADGVGPVFAKHVADTANFIIAHSAARPMIWDDAVAGYPQLFDALPKSLVFVNWHYGSEKTYRPYIDRIARAGFEQMVAPGALNWNEIYPDLDAALGNIDRFTSEGKAAHVLGLFQTVWHDDGETLFEATWYPVVYAAASAWESDSVDRERFARDFPAAFFGTDDLGYAADLASLARCRVLLRGNPREYGDYLFWSDAFEPDLANVAKTVDLPALRLAAEDAMTHLRLARPPLHANAADVMALAARRYDALGRAFEIANEARSYYADARANVGGKHDAFVYRGLFVTKYLFWEQRDALLALEPLVRTAWEYENRSSHEASVLERYHVAAARAIERADRISDTVYRDYVATKRLPTFDEALHL
ncbi:MAG: beta-N-acetylhexosaminidase [Candidatus Eremiobacteraeota bacterium]|nr:beta-N-acetylhexosaminidase [Candidatus Eremiobacteraeota bacterium]